MESTPTKVDPDLDLETIMQLLKEKAKELKTTLKKLKKVEDKYVEMHKHHKNLINDRENFIQFLHVVFPQNLVEEEILIMPEGSEGYGMFDVNHLRQFWTLTSQSKENEQLAMIQGMQDSKKQLADKITEYEIKESEREKTSIDLQDRLNQLLEENEDLKSKMSEDESSQKIQEVKQQVRQEYLDQITSMQKEVREVQAENSEFKAKQLMSAFQG